MNFRIFTAAMVLVGTTAFAQYSPNELRIYINPGHGSWTGNDRPMQVIGHEEYSSTNTDTTGFFESNTDLIKGFGVLEKLIEMGFPFDRTRNQEGERWEIGAARDLEQNLVMSRVKNGPYENDNTSSSENASLYNRSLLEIATEVEENEFDQFISIHSNAAGSGFHNNVNYHLFMYRGKNGQENEAVEGSWDMAEAANIYSFANEHAQWSEPKVYINGDVDFMGKGSGTTNELGYYGYLGVLKHGCPGYLVEGFFHTYTPSTHRAMNFDVDLLEGYQYARGVAEYFELDQRDTTGEIYGIVRDAHQSFQVDKIWIPRPGSDDVLMPVNGCTVTLSKPDGTEVDKYTTDNYYNGAFVFFGLQPGKYVLTFSHEGYLSGDPVEVEVTAGLTSYPKVYLTDIYYYGRPGEELNYVNKVPETITLNDSYDMTGAYVDREIPQLAGLTPKRMVYNKEHIYILGHDADGNGTIVVLNAITGNIVKKVSTNGILHNPNGILDLSDIQLTGAGVLVACGKSSNQSEDKRVPKGEERGELSFYYWNNDEFNMPSGDPILWFTTNRANEWYRAIVGESFLFRGNMDEGELLVSGSQTVADGGIRSDYYDVTNGVATLAGTCRPSSMNAKDYENSEFKFFISPINRHQFILAGNSTKYGMRDYDFRHTTSALHWHETPEAIGKDTRGAGFFVYGGDFGMTMATPDATTVSLYSIKRGISEANAINLNGITFQGETSHILTTGYSEAVLDAEGNAVGGNFSIIVLRDNRISRYSTDPTSGIDNVAADADTDAPVRFFDLNGREINGTPAAGIYIRVQGTTASKVFVK